MTSNFDQRLSDEQLLKLLARARAGKCGERDWLIYLLTVNHGLRISEVLALTTKDFDVADCTVTLKRGKKGKKTVQPLRRDDDPLLDECSAVRAYLDRRPSGLLFDIKRSMAGRLFAKYAREVGIPQRMRHVHVLRHTAAHTMLDAGVNLAHIQQWLGHQRISSTGIYVKQSDASAAQEVVSKVWAKK